MLRRLARAIGLSGRQDAIDWPSLPSNGFISGRVASKDDVDGGNAVFVLEGSTPLAIPVPQYATVIETGEGVIVVQAEASNGYEVVAVRSLDGEPAMMTLGELKLLGTRKPA